MKCKRIIKVVSALALTLALLVSSGVVGFAAEKTYTTTTTYINQDTIEVKSVATGLENGDMATYVAYNGNGFSEANAVYIDQATANGTDDVTFTYQTSSANVKATVKFGGSTETQGTKDPTIKGYNVTVTVDENAPYTVVVPEVDMTTYGDGYLVREIPVSAADGKAVVSVKVAGVEEELAWYAKDDVVYIYTNVITADAEVIIETADAGVEVKLGTVNAGTGKITAFARATCAQDADYGILIGGEATLADAVEWDKATDYTKAVKLPALGMGDRGGFCVEVEDTAITSGTYKVAAYAGEVVTAAISKTIE